MILLTTLLPHQAAAADKLMRPRVGALFMEMGTGKTRVVIELVSRREKRISRVIWLCPVSLMPTIAAELRKHIDSPLPMPSASTSSRTAKSPACAAMPTAPSRRWRPRGA